MFKTWRFSYLEQPQEWRRCKDSCRRTCCQGWGCCTRKATSRKVNINTFDISRCILLLFNCLELVFVIKVICITQLHLIFPLDDLQNQKISTSCSKVTLNSSQMAAHHRKVIITITHAKMETVMGEKINKSRHQMVQEETRMATKETIVHPIIKGNRLFFVVGVNSLSYLNSYKSKLLIIFLSRILLTYKL